MTDQLLSLFTLNRKTIFAAWIIVFGITFTVLNGDVSGTIQVNQISFAVFIIISLIFRHNLTSKGALTLLIAALLLAVGSLRGYTTEWFSGDLAKMILLIGGVYVYLQLISSMEDLKLVVSVYAYLFIATVIVSIVEDPLLVLDRYRLVILRFGLGAGAVGWGAAVLFMLYYLTEDTAHRWLRTLTLSALMCVILLSMSRTSFLLLFVFFAIFGNKKQIKSYCYFILFVTIVSIIILNTFIFTDDSELVAADILNYRVTDSAGRVDILQGFSDQILSGSLDNFILGVGIGGGTMAIDAAGFFARDPHNLYMDSFMIFGFLGFSALLFLMLFNWPAKNNRVGRAILVALIAAGFANSFWRISALLWLNSLLLAVPFMRFKTRHG